MALSILPVPLLPLLALTLHTFTAGAVAQATSSPKRGLVAIPELSSSEEQLFGAASTDLTWYYNYKTTPTAGLQKTKLDFLPMLFSANDSNPGTGFASGVTSLISKGANITTVLGFNEPDNCAGSTGGSCMPADLAATVWIQQLEPLRAQGIKLVSPAVTSADSGFTWMQNWFTACEGRCHPDFIGVHWYGETFEQLASHIGRVNATYPNVSGIYLTEWALPNANLTATQAFYNTSVQFLDRVSYVDRYSYFGAFKSSISNVGYNATFLDQKGMLTDLGSWYLGGSATGRIPEANASVRRAVCGRALVGGIFLALVLSLEW